MVKPKHCTLVSEMDESKHMEMHILSLESDLRDQWQMSDSVVTPCDSHADKMQITLPFIVLGEPKDAAGVTATPMAMILEWLLLRTTSRAKTN